MREAEVLSMGQGWCDCTAVLPLRIAPDVLEMDGAPDILAAVMQCLHHVNRRNLQDARIAVDFPGLDVSRPGFDRIGHRIHLFGGRAALDILLADKRFSGLVQSGKLLTSGLTDVDQRPSPGRILVRDQQGSKSTPAGLARARRRVERRGGTWEDRDHCGSGLAPVGRRPPFLEIGERKLVFRAVELPFTGRVRVSTYGIADSSAASGLPVHAV